MFISNIWHIIVKKKKKIVMHYTIIQNNQNKYKYVLSRYFLTTLYNIKLLLCSRYRYICIPTMHYLSFYYFHHTSNTIIITLL